MDNKIKKMMLASITAAIYVVVCFVLKPISFNAIQFRLSEILCLFSIDYLWAYIGVSIGCLISNAFIGEFGIMDIIFGTLATIIACGMAYLLRHRRYKGYPLLSTLMIVLINGIIVGAELGVVLDQKNLIPEFMLYVAIGELGVMLVGLPIYKRIKPLIDNKLLQ